ncbi:hypothetical protein [Tunturiibacter psychrotolerans]|uniref:hypothetical protein n=1 Tax=Tunturiibacter psychrotolerans TaxID=3069686 RepID=UPI003D2367E6
MGPWSDYLHRVASPKLYSYEQWFAAVFSAVCLGADGWVVARTLQAPKSFAGHQSLEDPTFVAGFWVLVVLLAVAALSLLVFAFSKP